MADKNTLRKNRYGTVINIRSYKQELDLLDALTEVTEFLSEMYGLKLVHDNKVCLSTIVDKLRCNFLDTYFSEALPKTFIRPDGGILSIVTNTGEKLPILITEVKNQGTNDLRCAEGKPKQPMGNAIERLGKNVLGLKAMMMAENIFPFICFGYGCDFYAGSSLFGRLQAISMFGAINKVESFSPFGPFNMRGSYFFREKKWSLDEMINPMFEIASNAIEFYIGAYGLDNLSKTC